jgi:Cofilin/tropomyosin-type actin-binding protein
VGGSDTIQLETQETQRTNKHKLNYAMATVADSAVTTFDEFKIGKAEAGYLVLKLVGSGSIEIVKKGPLPKPTWEEMVKEECLAGEPAWILYHFGYETAGGKRSKLCLCQWIPDDSGVSKKMQYAMWSNTLKQSLNGIACVIQASGIADVDFQEALQRVSKFERDEIAA